MSEGSQIVLVEMAGGRIKAKNELGNVVANRAATPTEAFLWSEIQRIRDLVHLQSEREQKFFRSLVGNQRQVVRAPEP